MQQLTIIKCQQCEWEHLYGYVRCIKNTIPKLGGLQSSLSYYLLWFHGVQRGRSSLRHSIWHFHQFDTIAEGWPSGPPGILLCADSPRAGSCGLPSMTSSAQSHFLHAGSGLQIKFSKITRAKAARLLRTWPHQFQSITPFVRKTLEPALIEGRVTSLYLSMEEVAKTV